MGRTGTILSLGSVNLDVQVRADRWPDPGETLVARDLLWTGGGKAANVAFLARKLGAPVALIARVGDDREADVALRSLTEIDVDLRSVRRLSGERTGIALITVRANGDKAILLLGNANDAWEDGGPEAAAQVVREAPEGSVLVLDFEVPAAVARSAMQEARRRRLRVLLDPSPANRVDKDCFELIDYVTPNAAEAKRLVGFNVDTVDDGFRAADALRADGVRSALVKLGAAGCAVVGDDIRTHIPVRDVTPIDKTGAGDAFAGALAFALWEGQGLEDAARFAVAASALAVTGYGSQASYPARPAIERLLEGRFTE